MKRLLTGIVISMAAFAFGAEETVNGITWQYTIVNGEASLSPNTIPYDTVGAITIPSTLGGCPVTSIGMSAFQSCFRLTSITIPDSVTNIGDSAFLYCDSLKSVRLPKDVSFASYSGRSMNHIGFGGLEGNPAYQSVMMCSVLPANGILGEPMESSQSGGSSTGGSSGYSISDIVGDSTITSMTISSDTAIDSFLLTDGKVFDMAIRIVNTSASPVRLSLPSGYDYETIGDADPLEIPASSTNMITVTRTAAKTFLVSRQQLRKVQ